MIIYLASPYSGDVERNAAYARECMRHALAQGEVPIAPHLLFTQALDDSDHIERDAGMRAGRELIAACERLVAFVDLGISKGMKDEIEHARAIGVPVEMRKIRLDRALPSGWRECRTPSGYIHVSGRVNIAIIDGGFVPYMRGSGSGALDEAVSDARAVVAMLEWLRDERGVS